MHVQPAPVQSLEQSPAQSLVHQVSQDAMQPLHWKVESKNVVFGDVYVVIFSGPLARERAIEYAKFKNGQ